MPLSHSVTKISGVGESYAQKLQRLGISTILDLLYHIPHRYIDFSRHMPIHQLQPDETVTVTGTVTEISNSYTRRGKRITTAYISDNTGMVPVIWFNQTYLTNVIREGDTLSIAGKTSWWSRELAIIAPLWEKHTEDSIPGLKRILPIYPETEGITSSYLRKIITHAWEEYQCFLQDTLHETIVQTHALLSLHDALKSLHFPEDEATPRQAQYRLAFEEMYNLQKRSNARRIRWNEQTPTFVISHDISERILGNFPKSLPFELTSAQLRVIREIIEDLSNKQPMNRLLQGDVGSGKTVVSAAAAYAAILSGQPAILMAPTEVLAQQHFETIKEIFKNQPHITIALLTGSTRSEDVSHADFIIGTHAIFYNLDVIPDAGLVIVDEQHKFGVEQRAALTKRQDGLTPHILTMTATPIPRSIALTVYGDQDLSRIDEMPPGRKKVKTWLVPDSKRSDAYSWINKQISDSTEPPVQALFIYPLIEESEHESMQDVQAATKAYTQLSQRFSKHKVALIHGKLPAAEKNKIAQSFREGDIDILIATSVVEVGIDAPHASIMIIENAERFGLATLHQLRGRVGRRGQQAYCLLFTNAAEETTIERLKALETHHDGLKLSEIDLRLRGPGQVFGKQQHGVGELRFASITDLDLIAKTREAVIRDIP